MTTAHAPRGFPRRAEIEAKILSLPIREENLPLVPLLADNLALIGMNIAERKGDGTAPPHFRPATPRMVLKELVELRRLVESLETTLQVGGDEKAVRARLAKHIQSLHEPTIVALSDSSFALSNKESVRIDTLYFRSTLARDLVNGEHVSLDYIRLLAGLATAAQRASIEVQSVGRLPDNRARAVANILAHQYKTLTGLDPTFSTVVDAADEGKVYGQFLSFVTDIFKLLNIERDALSFASRAAFRLRGKGRKQ